MASAKRPKLAVWKLTSCDGCQLSLLNQEDELLELAEVVRIAQFLEASSATERGPYALSLVEGSVSTAAEIQLVKRIRRRSRLLVAMGACATAGGIQALRNVRDVGALAAAAYPGPETPDTLDTSTAVSEHVAVDYELWGCPVNGRQLLELIAALLAGRAPAVRGDAVCLECKRAGVVCVMTARGVPCLGPVTRAGCGALCPAHARGCYGCYGPKDAPNTGALAAWWRQHLGVSEREVARAFLGVNADAPAFRAEGEAHGRG